MKLFKRNGFTLIEILLVIGVIMIMSIIKIRDINEETEDVQAKMLASQIQTVADATNAFLVLKYNELSTLSSTGVSCNSGTNTCNITLQNLNDNALLPPNFATNSIMGSPYEIQLKRTGTSPNYMMSGVVITKANKNTENTPSLVFSGKVLRDIGRDGGLNKTEGKIIGTSNGWSADSSLFPVLSGKTGYVGSAVGTLSGAYYVYLRRDGTLPMTGDLNLDGHNIKNVNNLTATGALTTTGNISGANISATGTVHANKNITTGENIVASKEVTAHNGLGAEITIGGDANEDYEIRLSNGKYPLSIYSPNATDYTTVLNVFKNVRIYQRLGLMGYDPNDLPAGWGGGLRTLDVYASGTVGTGSNGDLTSYMNATGVHTTQNITAGGNITGSYIKSSGNIDSDASMSAGFIHSRGDINSNGRINSGEYLYMNGQAIAGSECSPNGLQGRTYEGQLLSCVNGTWRNSSAMCLSSSFPGAVGKTRCSVISYSSGLLTGICADQNPTHDPNHTGRPYTWLAIDVPVKKEYITSCN